MCRDAWDGVVADQSDAAHPAGDAQGYGGPEFESHVTSTDEGKAFGPLSAQRRKIDNSRRIGSIVFDEAVASYNGDFELHFPHRTWRQDRNEFVCGADRRFNAGIAEHGNTSRQSRAS
jgi:hypothetical protein